MHLNGAGLAGSIDDWPVVLTQHSCVLTWWLAVPGKRPPATWDWSIARMTIGLDRVTAVSAPSQAFATATMAGNGVAPALRVIHHGHSSRPFGQAHGQEPIVRTADLRWEEGENLAALDRAAPAIA